MVCQLRSGKNYVKGKGGSPQVSPRVLRSERIKDGLIKPHAYPREEEVNALKESFCKQFANNSLGHSKQNNVQGFSMVSGI